MGQSWLAGVFADTLGVTVTYTPMGGTPVPLRVFPIGPAPVVDLTNTPQARIDYSVRQYRIRLSDFTTATGRSEPKEGDRAVETIAGVSRTFEAMPDETETLFRWSDTNRTAFVVRMKPR